MRKGEIYGIDFDGTCVEYAYPEVGADVPSCVLVLKALLARGDQLILWTMRSGAELQAAVDWFAERGLPLLGVNSNPDQAKWTDSPKAYCTIYIDDAALGCPLLHPTSRRRAFVHWGRVAQMVGVDLEAV